MRLINFDQLHKLLYIAILLVGFWDINVIFCLVAFTLVVTLVKEKGHSVVSRIDILFYALMCYELLNYCCSIYQDASFDYLFKVIILWLFYQGFKYYLAANLLNKQVNVFLCVYGGALAIGSIIMFFLLYFEMNFDDWVNFKFLFRPFGKLVNDWVTVMLLFLVFAAICFAQSGTRKSQAVYLAILITIVYAVIISFSLGAYVALFFFYAVCNIFLTFLRVSSVKKIMLANSVFLLVLFLVTWPVHGSIISTLGFDQNISQVRSTTGRLELWENCFRIFNKNLFLGTGSNNFSLAYNQLADVSEDAFFTGRVLNTPLQILIEKGVFGVVLYSALFFSVIHSAVMLLRREIHINDKVQAGVLVIGLLALFIRELTFSSLLENTGTLFLVTIIILLIRNLEIKYRVDAK